MPDMTTTKPASEERFREAVGVFHDVEAFEEAIDELQVSGFDRYNIGVLAGEEEVKQHLGHAYQSIEELEDDQQVPRGAYAERDSVIEAKAVAIAGIGYLGAVIAVVTVVASGGTLMSVIEAAIAAGFAGAVIGMLIANWIGFKHEDDLRAQLKKGGILLWVGINDDQHGRRALKILQKYMADDVHVHEFKKNRLPARNPLDGRNPDPLLPGAKI